MKKCPNCGAQNADDSRFCTECGKEFPQGNVCPHCGASVNEGDAFCVNCGKKLSDIDNPELSNSEICTADENNDNSRKKIVPYIIALCVIGLLLGGLWWWKGSTNKTANEDAVADTITVAANSQEEQIREQLQSICDFLITNVSDEEVIRRYFSTEFNKLYKEVVEIDSRSNEMGFETFIGIPGQDGHYTKAEVKQVTIKSESTATADVLFTIGLGDNSEIIKNKTETFYLLFENDKWVIDDYQNYKKEFQEYVKENAQDKIDYALVDTVYSDTIF